MIIEGKKLEQSRNKIQALLWMILAACITLASCARLGPISLNHAVLNYDSTVLKSQKDLLLLNIVRMHDDQPPHFTVSSDIKATFTFSTTNGIIPTWNVPLANSRNTNTLGLNLNTTVSESPTITITPMEGKDFAARLLKPIDSAVANMVFSQKGTQIDKLLRLTGHSFLMIRPKDAKGTDIYPEDVLKYLAQEYGCFTEEGDRSCHLVNSPRRIPLKREEPAEKTKRLPAKAKYELFRQVVLHIKAMEMSGHLFFSPLEFDQDVEGTFSEKAPNTKDITDALDKHYRFKMIPGGWKLTKPYTILAISDFPKDELDKTTLEEIATQLELSDHIKLDQSVIIVLLRGSPNYQKANWPIYGLFRLRNFTQVLQFLAESLKRQPGYRREYDVDLSPFTKALLARNNLKPGDLDNPPLTLTVGSGNTPPEDAVVNVRHSGESYWVSSAPDQTVAPSQPIRWDKQVFELLYDIFQMNRIEPSVSPTLVSIGK